MRRGLFLCAVIAVLGSSTVRAEDPDGSSASDTVEIRVTARRGAASPPQAQEIDIEAIAGPCVGHVGEALVGLPGVHAVERGGGMTEPVIRGLGWERVTTEVSGIPMYGACPARMDPPVTYARRAAVDSAAVVFALPSVIHGPGGTGGRIIVRTDYRRPDGAPDGFGGSVGLTWDSNRRGFRTDASVRGGFGIVDFRVGLEGSDLHDYRDGAGRDVPAEHRSWSTNLSLAFRPSEDLRCWTTGSYLLDDRIEFPSLPMDADESKLITWASGFSLDLDDSGNTTLEARLGLARLDHRMSNREKANRALMDAATRSESDSFGARVMLTCALDENVTLRAGLDGYHLARDALRRRDIHASGRTFQDRIWPDASQFDLGAFAEMSWSLGEDLTVRLGGRIDRVHSDADAVDGPSLGGLTVREQYVRYYGDDASDVERTEIVAGANLLIEHELDDGLAAHLGVGLVSRPAGVTERFFAFAPAPGGYLVGDPSLSSEKKIELVAGLGWRIEGLSASLSVYHNWVRDYILTTRVASLDVTGDAIPDPIKGYRNVDARLWGCDGTLRIAPTDWLSFPITFAWVTGRNTTGGRPLPEIPPLTIGAAVRATGGVHEDVAGWLELGGRFVAEQDRVDERFPEDRTPGHAVFHLRAGLGVGENVRLELGVENLLDREYHDHLTPPVVVGAGDLEPGDDVPAPGRTFLLRVEVDF